METAESIKQVADYILKKILKEYELEVEEQDGVYNVIIKTDDEASTIIGRHGETIRAFQKVLEVSLYNELNEAVRLLVDVNDYRAKQRERLEYIATQHAERVQETKAPAYLRGFSSYERKIMHEYVTNEFPDLTSYSLGDGKDRRLVVTLKSDDMIDVRSMEDEE